MTEHTPGPWSTTGSMIQSEYKTFGGVFVAQVVDHASGEHIANARLIAAAPELLEALQSVLAGDDDHWQVAEAAVAKATA